jgi:thioredoxin reductase
MREQLYDCIVVGAGPAGLSASLLLARYHRRFITFHQNTPRNIYSNGVHGFLGHDGIHPKELLKQGSDEVRKYGGQIVEACVTKAEKIADDHFRVTVSMTKNDERTFDARRLLLTTGLRDRLPECKGFREFYGCSVHHCPDCDGFESEGKHIAVLGPGKKGIGYTLELLTWSDRLTLITEGDDQDITDDHRALLARYNIPILNHRIEALEGDFATKQLQCVRFLNGDSLACDALFFNLGTEPSCCLHENLKCRMEKDRGLVWVGEKQESSVRGVYVAGDLTPTPQLVAVAVSEGAAAAVHIHKSLYPEEWGV